MTRLVTCGYETGDVNEAGASNVGGTGSPSLAIVSSVPTPRLTGSYCLKCNAGVIAGTTNAYKLFTLPSNYTDLWIRLGFYIHQSASTTGEIVIVGFYDSSGANQACVTYSSTDSLFRARQNVSTGGTLLGTSTAGAVQDTWHLLEVRWQATSTTSGTTEVWLNGTRVINVTADNVATTNANVGRVALGWIAGNPGITAGAYLAVDDIAVNNTSGTRNNGQVGDGRVVLLIPNGAGSSTVLTRGGTNTGANYSQVNELPPSMSEYVLSATAGDRDLYALTDAPSTTTSVSAVEVTTLAQNSDAGAGSLGLTVKSGATTNEATAQALSSGPAYYRALYETDPNTSAAWTLSALNALEAGVTVR